MCRSLKHLANLLYMFVCACAYIAAVVVRECERFLFGSLSQQCWLVSVVWFVRRCHPSVRSPATHTHMQIVYFTLIATGLLFFLPAAFPCFIQCTNRTSNSNNLCLPPSIHVRSPTSSLSSFRNSLTVRQNVVSARRLSFNR